MSSELIQFNQQNQEYLLNIFNASFQNTPISLFTYVMYYKQEAEECLNEEYFLFTIDLKWSEKRLSREWAADKFFQARNQALLTSKVYPFMWSFNPTNDELMEALFYHGFREGLTLYKAEGSKIHSFNFAINRGSNVENSFNFYLHNLAKFWNYSRMFLTSFENYWVDLNRLPTAKNKFTSVPIIKLEENKIKNNSLKKIRIFRDKSSVYITSSQFLLMQQLAQGLSLKQIANNMKLSVRTLEGKYTLLKKHLDSYSRDKIVKLWEDNNI